MIPKQCNAGFTLIELALVLLIVTLLAGGLLTALPAQQDIQSQAATERQLADARDALLGYAAANGYLPCPAKSASDGNEDRSAGACTGGKRIGMLPWITLGLGATDLWGRRLRYSVTPAFASSASPFTLNSGGDITVRTRNDSGALVDLTKPSETVAALWSTGKNGYWGWPADAAAQNADSAAANDDEDANSGGSATGTLLISRPPTPPGSSQGEFDDGMAWLPRSLLLNRMVAAGRLP